MDIFILCEGYNDPSQVGRTFLKAYKEVPTFEEFSEMFDEPRRGGSLKEVYSELVEEESLIDKQKHSSLRIKLLFLIN